MIGLFFEVQTKPGHRDQYLDLAASLKPDLEAMGGCRFIDRFNSLTRENLLLSYQIWQDEGALTAWRAHADHHDIQTIGRERVFSDYRIRVAQVIYEERPGQPAWQPERRTPYNDPARRKPTYILASESKHASAGRGNRMAPRFFRERLSRRAFCASGRFAGRSSRHRIRPAPVCRSNDRVLSYLRSDARLRNVRAHRSAAVLSASRASFVGWAKARKHASLCPPYESTPKSPSPSPPDCAARISGSCLWTSSGWRRTPPPSAS